NAHELLRNAYLSTQWGGSLDLRPPRLHFTAHARDQAERQFADWERVEQHLHADGIAGVVPAGSQPINQYPAASWHAVIERLWREYRVLCAIIAPPDQQRFVDQIVAN